MDATKLDSLESDVNMSVYLDLVTPRDIGRDEYQKERRDEEKVSRALWKKMTDQDHNDVKSVVEQHLLRLITSLEHWLPGSVDINELNQLKITMLIPLGKLDNAEIRDRLQIVAAAREGVLNSLLEIEQGLRGRMSGD